MRAHPAPLSEFGASGLRGSRYRESALSPNNSDKGREWAQAPQTEKGISRTRMGGGAGGGGQDRKEKRGRPGCRAEEGEKPSRARGVGQGPPS